MRITINDKRNISAIQEEFNNAFPFLKLEFFTKLHKVGDGTDKKHIKQSSKTLGECRTVQNKGHVTIIPQMTVAELEQLFNDAYGLGVQVFRKSGKVWLETTVTDAWTLEQQNNEGESLSKIMTSKNER